MYGGSKQFYNAFIFKDVIYGQSSTGGFYKFIDEGTDYISGHIDEITSLCWLDSFILTTSLDKTSRIFLSNREVMRAQNHGYPISVGKFLNEDDLSIISGAQETIIRVLQPTYISYMAITSNDKLNEYLATENSKYSKEGPFKGLENYKIAAVPAELSLTNDAIDDFGFESLNEYLLSTTAFNEMKKLYGHYFDIVDLDVSKNYIVSVNKALTKKFSGLFLWNRDFKIIQYLEVHNSTINRVRFSPNGKYICTASKDKTSALLEINEEMILKHINTDHNRVVWDCTFSHDSLFYATCSRDKKIIIYDIPNNKKQNEFSFEHEVTTIDFNPTKYEILAGLESGELVKIIYNDKRFEIDFNFKIKSNSKKINIIRYNRDGRYVGVGGSDWLLTIYEIKYN
jgi:elongator complex protein 2